MFSLLCSVPVKPVLFVDLRGTGLYMRMLETNIWLILSIDQQYLQYTRTKTLFMRLARKILVLEFSKKPPKMLQSCKIEAFKPSRLSLFNPLKTIPVR